MEKKPYHHLSDGTFRNPEGSPVRTSKAKFSYTQFIKLKKKIDMTVPKEHVVDKEKVLADLANWGALLNKHLGPAKTGDKRLLEILDVDKNVPVDKNNDGITDQVDGEDVFEIVKKKQVTITIKQDKIEERFRRLFLAGT